jgi:3-hydroxyisobutyrate dehydrogenase-like beta-hydroxyacid dehydrogenase
MAVTTVAIIGAGAMGSAIARRLIGHGARVLTRLAGRSQASRNRAAEAGMANATFAELAGAAVVLSVVPPAQVGAVVEEMAPLFSYPKAPVFCDANACNPQTKQRLAARVAEFGGRMVDGSIIGPPPSDTADARLYLSGAGADEVAVLAQFGIDARVLNGPLGAAAALKMCYGGINKGSIGLTTAMLLAAERHGAADDLVAEFAISQQALLERSRKQIPEMFSKAWRWGPEMEEVAGFLEQDDPAAAAIWRALAQFYAERAGANEAGVELATLKGILAP